MVNMTSSCTRGPECIMCLGLCECAVRAVSPRPTQGRNPVNNLIHSGPSPMATSDHALEANIDHMIVATPGKDVPDPNKTAPKRTLFSSPPAAAHTKTNESTPTTTEKRHTRESSIVIMRGGCITDTPGQIVEYLIKAIESTPQYEELMRTKPLELTTQAMVKITHDGSPLLKHKDLVFLKEGLQGMQTMFVTPKTACVGVFASQIAGYFDIYQRISQMTQKENWGDWGLAWMKEVNKLFDTGTAGEFEMSFERSLDRHKDKIKYCSDAAALGFASWALPHVINALIKALKLERSMVGDPEGTTADLGDPANTEKKETMDKHFNEFQMELKESLKRLGVQGCEREDGWVVYPMNETVEITSKGLEVLRLPAGIKVEMKKLISTEELQSSVDVYLAPQTGIFNIKRGFREGGEGVEAVLTELGDDVIQVIPRIKIDTETTGLIKLMLRVKLTSEKEIEKKLQALCKDVRNEAAEIKGIVTKLASGAEVRMVWSGDLGTARVRNGLNRVAAITAEVNNKSSEEVKKLKMELEKQIKGNVDALAEQDAKISAYTVRMQEIMDKQASVVTDMQGQHGKAMDDLQKQMAASEALHSKTLADSEAQHTAAMDDLRRQLSDMQQVVKQQQQMQLSFTAQAGDLTQTLSTFMNAVKHEMMLQRSEMQASALAIKELKGESAGYVEAASALARRQCAVLRDVFVMYTQVTALASLARAGLPSQTTELPRTGDATPRGIFIEEHQARGRDEKAHDMSRIGDDKHDGSWKEDAKVCGEKAALSLDEGVRQTLEPRRTDNPDRTTESGERGSQEGDQSMHLAMTTRPGVGSDRNSGQGAPSGEVDGLCGILTLGISDVESVIKSISTSPKGAGKSFGRVESSGVEARRNERGKSGSLTFASTRGFHGMLVLLLCLTTRGEALPGMATCCTTMDLRRADTSTLLCRDATDLRCYDRSALLRFGISGRGAPCNDAGLAFWNCFDESRGSPNPTKDSASVGQDAEPEPSPRWTPEAQDEAEGQIAIKQSVPSHVPTSNTYTTGSVKFIHTQQAAVALGSPWTVTRNNIAIADPNCLRRRRLRWHIDRRAWKRLMRALRGNTVANMFHVALWNAREFHVDANPSREASRKKMLWIMSRLLEEDVDVCFLLEVVGAHEAFTAEVHGLRAFAAKIGYCVRWMVGEGGSQREQRQSSESHTNGIAVLVKKATCTIERYVRIEERVLGVWLQGRNGKEQIRMRAAAIHGLHHEGTSSFKKQLQATHAWATDATHESKGCLVVGDFNYVADVMWRSSGTELDSKDKLFKDFIAQPGVEYVSPIASRPMIIWTRRGDTATEGSNAEGSGAMLDGAVAIGCECTIWRRTIVDFAFDRDGPSAASAKPLSDHAWITFSREVPRVVCGGERRPLSALPRGDEHIKDGYRDRVRDGDVHEKILQAHGTVHATTAAVQILRSAAEQVAAEARVRREERPLEMAHRWRRWLQEAYAARHRGVSPHDIQGGLFNYHSQLWRIRSRYEGSGDDVCWAMIIRRCRRCWKYANQRLRRKQQREDARLREMSLDIIEGKGSKDLAQLAMIAWKAIRPQRTTLAFDRFHPRDDVHEAPMLAADNPDAFLNGLAQEGDRLVNGFASTPPIIEAFKAFCKVFCPTYETLRGKDGGEWELAKELTFPVFLQVLQRVPRGKAVGYGGFSIELLIHAGREVKRAFYDCLIADLLGGEFPPSWRKVIYVLLAKPPPNNQALISERREIALMAQDMKLVMHMIRATAYRLITGRLRSEQCGWLPGYGTVDAGIPLATVIQQAQRLRQSLWILYVDLATFFPRIDREALTIAEVLVGLPPPVIELVGQIYGAGRAVAAEAVECQFDTSIGLSASFRNHMGALMGEVLSPDRAKIILNSILWAIHLHVHGVQLFGFGEDDDGRIRAVASLAYADDWAGTFTSEADLKRAWAIWSVWIPISGSKLGIKNKLKTVVTGVLRDEQGHERDIVDPMLITLEGVRVPVLSRSEAYKHLGVLRVAMGGDGAAADSLKKQLRAAIGRVARMHKPSRRDMILVTNGLFQGLAGFKCSTVYYTFEWMEEVEREWRRVFNRKARRDASTPACLLYEEGGGSESGGRRHLWAIGCSAFYVAFTRALADKEDTSQRAAARSALALGLSRWGVQGDPRTFSWRHLNEKLERHLKGQRRYLGEIFMFISSLVQDDDSPKENWRWTVQPKAWDPLNESRPHFRRLESIALFETEKMGGLGIEPAVLLMDARIRAAGQMATWGAGEDGPRWLAFQEARRLYPWLHTKAGTEWDKTVAALEERLTEVVAPEREAVCAWGQSGLVLDSEGLRLGQRAVKGTSTDEVGEKALHAAILSTHRDMSEGREPGQVEWEALLRNTFRGIGEPKREEWCVGGGDVHADAAGGRMFIDIDCDEEPRGGEAAWLQRSDIDEQGFLTGWAERASMMRFHYIFDEMGFLCLRQGGRLESHQLGQLDPAVQITARARLALGDVKVIPGDGIKRQETHIQLLAQRELWGKLTTWSARICATRIYTLDGGWREVKTEDGGRVRIATRAAIDHEGHVLGGRIFEANVKADNYIAELAAQLDALTDAVRRGSEERIIVVFDATSPVRAMLRFGRLSARARGDRLAAELLEHFERLRRRVAVLVLLWQTSHVGEPLNEWADVVCDTFGLEDDYPIPRGIVEFASMTFPAHKSSAQEYVMQGMRRVVAARLRNRVSGTVLRDNTEQVHLLGVTKETHQLCDEIAARRCQYVDQPYANTTLRRLLQAEWCPFGCRTLRDGWREIHASAGARRRVVINHRLAALLRTRLQGARLGEICVVSELEDSEYGGAEVRSGDAICDGEKWFSRAECAPTWWHFHFECVGDPLLAARKAYALQAVEARRRMVASQSGKELVPHSQLDDLILLIHQGLQGWVHLREQLLRAALGDSRELWSTGVRIAELRILQKYAWRRWLSLGGWGALHLCNLKIARAKRGRALATQRESMRRWAKKADGHCWQLLTTQEVEERFELTHEELRALLATKQILSAGEWRRLGINNLRVGHYVRVGQGPTEVFYGPVEVTSQHTLSGSAVKDVGEVIEIEIAPRWDLQRGKKRRQDVLRARREVRQRIVMGPVRNGVEADDGGRWAVRGIRAVRRHEGRRGRPLDVLVEWEGEDSDGDPWEESWVSVTYLTADLRAEARRLEAELFGPRATQAGPTSRRANHREDARRRQERERKAQQWRARLRDRAPRPPSA